MEFIFEISKGTPKKGTPKSDAASDKENESDVGVGVTEKIEEAPENNTSSTLAADVKPIETKPIETKPIEAKTVEIKPVEEPKPQRAPEVKAEEKFVKPETPVEQAPPVQEKDSKEDQEDSLNLTIGEEDEKLFNEDVS